MSIVPHKDPNDKLNIIINDVTGWFNASEKLIAALTQAIVAITTSTAKTMVLGVVKEVMATITEVKAEIKLIFASGKTMLVVRKFESTATIYSNALKAAEQNSDIRKQQREILIKHLEAQFIAEMEHLGRESAKFA